MRSATKQGTARRSRDGAETKADIDAERTAVLGALRPLVKMIGALAGPHVEVVLHDLLHPERSVIEIANGHISNRAVGSPIISGPKDDKAFAAARRELSVRGKPVHSVIEVYPTVTADGKRLKSSTVIFRDRQGEPFAALCLNADLTVFEMVQTWLERFLDATPKTQDAQIDVPEIGGLVNDIIIEAIRRCGKPVAMMTKEEKLQAVRSMMHRGVFLIRGGVERAAVALGVSRFTVYNYLEELRGEEEGESSGTTGKTNGRRNGSLKSKLASKAKVRRAARRTG